MVSRQNSSSRGLTSQRLLQSLFFLNRDPKFIIELLKKTQNKWYEYPEGLVWCILSGNLEVTQYLLENKVSLDYPPASVSEGFTNNSFVDGFLKNYKPTPYITMAAVAGQVNMLEFLLTQGRSLHETGHIGYSKFKQNSVIGNVLCAAIMNERTEVVTWLLDNFSEVGKDYRVQEEKAKGGRGGLNKEYSGCTPLLLAAHCANLEIIQHLLNSGFDLKALDWQKNNILHIAVKLNRLELVEILVNTEVEVYARNQLGQTPISLARDRNLVSIEEFLSQKLQDPSQQAAEELINSLMQEETPQPKKAEPSPKEVKKPLTMVVLKPESFLKRPIEKPKDEPKPKDSKPKEEPKPKDSKPKDEPKPKGSKPKEPPKPKKQPKEETKQPQEEPKPEMPVGLPQQPKKKRKKRKKTLETPEAQLSNLQNQLAQKDREIAFLKTHINLLNGSGDYSKLTTDEREELKTKLKLALLRIGD